MAREIEGENRELRSIVPTVAAAKEMQRGATLYTDFDNVFLDAEEPLRAQDHHEDVLRVCCGIGFV